MYSILFMQQFPYQVRLNIATAKGSSLCGGTILTNQYVITAAHCLYGKTITSVTVYAGNIYIGSSSSTEQTSLMVRILST